MHRFMHLAITIVTIIFLLAGCTGMRNETSTFLMIITAVCFAMAVFGGVIVIFSNDRTKQENAGIVATVALTTGVILAVLLFLIA